MFLTWFSQASNPRCLLQILLLCAHTELMCILCIGLSCIKVHKQNLLKLFHLLTCQWKSLLVLLCCILGSRTFSVVWISIIVHFIDIRGCSGWKQRSPLMLKWFCSHRIVFFTNPLHLHSIYLQAITSLKKGAYLLKYGRRGKPKFCPFRLSNVSCLAITILTIVY